MVGSSIGEDLSRRVCELVAHDLVREPKLAYCALMYGSSPSHTIIANALAMADSLQSSEFPLTLLVTHDVPDFAIDLFRSSSLFEEIRTVPYLMADAGLFKKDWFREVFTKLHIFNLTDFDKVLFLDLDVVVTDVAAMDALLRSSMRFAAMENSKGHRAGSMWLRHGEVMGDHCGLINAGVILVSPDATLFDLMVADFSHPSPSHVPGMTPEQFYLARVFGRHMHHLDQRYNFEVQLHGGVPVTKLWRSADYNEVVCFHFSGGDPLARLRDSHPDWGCQMEKYSAKEKWNSEFSSSEKAVANNRAKQAFSKWAYHLSHACSLLKVGNVVVGPELVDLIQAGSMQEPQKPYRRPPPAPSSPEPPKPSRRPPPVIPS